MKLKFTLSLLAFSFIALTPKAQINKGVIALGGNLNFNTLTAKSESDKRKQTSITISPSFMLFNKDNRAIGFNLNYGHLDVDISGSSNTYGAGIFLRQYKPLSKSFYVFAQEALMYNYTKGLVDSSTYYSFVDNRSHQVSLTVNPGIAYDLSKHFQLEVLLFSNLLSVSYSHSQLLTHDNNGADEMRKYNSLNAGANFSASQLTSLTIGAHFFFGK